MKGVNLMDRRYPLAGEESFRDMVQYQAERRRLSGDRWNGTSGSLPSNVVSMNDYRQQRMVTKRPPYQKPSK
jgi:hypothetical protein